MAARGNALVREADLRRLQREHDAGGELDEDLQLRLANACRRQGHPVDVGVFQGYGWRCYCALTWSLAVPVREEVTEPGEIRVVDQDGEVRWATASDPIQGLLSKHEPSARSVDSAKGAVLPCAVTGIHSAGLLGCVICGTPV